MTPAIGTRVRIDLEHAYRRPSKTEFEVYHGREGVVRDVSASTVLSKNILVSWGEYDGAWFDASELTILDTPVSTPGDALRATESGEVERGGR